METGVKPVTSIPGTSLHVVLCCATLFARDGLYDSAERLLAAIPAESATADVFDLLARIYAQQKRYPDAEAQWTHAIQLDPANRDYQRCVREAERRRLYPASFARKWILGILLILVALVATLSLWEWTRAPAHVKVAPAQPLTETQVQRSASPTEFRFSGPLFSSGTRFTRVGGNQIRKIGRQIRAASRIEIIGQTDSQQLKPRSKYRDNQELGLARASAVALLLHNEFGIPLTKMTVASGGPPDLGDRLASGHERRTAVIRVWQEGQ